MELIPIEAIERALAGGWQSKCSNCQESWVGHKQTRIGNKYCTTGPDPYRTALDPSFWQSLGKALGWNGVWQADTYSHNEGEDDLEKAIQLHSHFYFRHDAVIHGTNTQTGEAVVIRVAQTYPKLNIEPWLFNGRRFADLILTGQDTTDYWKELLTTK